MSVRQASRFVKDKYNLVGGKRKRSKKINKEVEGRKRRKGKDEERSDDLKMRRGFR